VARLFFAIRPADHVLDAALAEISRLKESEADVKWLDREHLHVTLRFLGEVPDEKVAAVRELLLVTCRAARPLDLRSGGIGTFPRWPRPRVIWGAVYGRSEESQAGLERLREALNEGATALGFPSDDRGRFVAHLTFGRFRSQKNSFALRNLIGSNTSQYGDFQVSELLLIQSRLSPSGSTYTVLERARLGG
jgi:RNA 2',3'-cyclic 3'-phosphodiesterase